MPGFVDTHVHGGGGFDYATEDPQVAISGRAFHAAHGTTTSFASLVTAPDRRALSSARDCSRAGRRRAFRRDPPRGAVSVAAQRGAHDPALLRTPDPATVERLIRRAGAPLHGHPRAGAARGAGRDPPVHRRRGDGSPSATPTPIETVAAALDAGATCRHPPVQRHARHPPSRARAGPGAARRRPGAGRADRRRFPPAPEIVRLAPRRPGRTGIDAGHRRHGRGRHARRGVQPRGIATCASSTAWPGWSSATASPERSPARR